MVDVNDDAPDFTAPLANGDVESFTLSEHLDEAPLVLAFFPGAFTEPCTNEMAAFRDDISEYEDVGATVYGISVDSPVVLNEFREQNDLNFGLISDSDKEIIDKYGVRLDDFVDMGYAASQRAVFVVDADGTITHKWVADEPSNLPDFDEIQQAAADAA
jgi:peroxiredoxin